MSSSASVDTLYLQIAERIARPIRAGTLVRGERIPSVRELARQQGVSLSTVVQAYRTLEDARLIEARPRSGYFVAARAPRLPEPDVSLPPPDSQPVDVSSLGEQVMRMATDPTVTSFGAACPSGDLFAQERVRRAVSRAAQRHRATLCRYPIGPGHEQLRRAIARHALGLGCQLDALQLAFDTQPVKAVLAVPTLSNPVGASMPLAERRRLAQMVAARGIPLIEDVLYNDLAEQDDRRRAVKSFDADGHVMICGSFSKTVAPGIRLGWVEAGRWGAQVRRLKAVHSGGHTELLELAMADLLTQPGHESAYRQLRTLIAARVDEARGLIAESFPRGTRVTDPAGGFILWVELPGGLDSMTLYRACLAERICIAPGTMFSATDRYRHCIRLGVGGRWDDSHRAALRRIGELARLALGGG
jgi:DNA-binding transcriptional MocR family regulator